MTAPVSARKPRVPASAARRESLLDAAFGALVKEGPHFHVEHVAARAGASKSLVFYHFGSHEGLLDAMATRVLSETQDGLARIADENPSAQARREALARALLEEPGEDSPPAATRHVMSFWLLTDATGSCRGALRDALLADFVRDPRASDLILARWHGATVRYAMGRDVEWEREADALVAELREL
jgi:AcrR family transcriptional regulator